MKVRNVNWKKLGTISILVNILLISTLTYVIFASPNGTFTISPGIYPGAPSFTIWKEGSTYYAKNAYGGIEFSGTNASQVIQNALDGLTSGRTWQETVLLKGEIRVDSTIRIPSYSIIDIQGTIKLADGANVNVFENQDQTNGNSFITIKNGIIDLNGGQQTQASRALYIIGRTNDYIKLVDVTIKNAYSATVQLINSSFSEIINNFFDTSLNGGSIGIVYTRQTTIAHNRFKNIYDYAITIGANSYRNEISNNLIYWFAGSHGGGIDIYGSSQNTIIGNVIRNSNRTNVYPIYLHVDGANNPARYNTIVGNTIFDSFHHAIALGPDSNYTTIADNVIIGTGQTGIRIADSHYLTISGNIVKYNGQEAIGDALLLDSVTYSIVTGNIFGDRESTRYGINEAGTSDYNVFTSLLAEGTNMGIRIVGANTQVNLCWNGTTWIP